LTVAPHRGRGFALAAFTALALTAALAVSGCQSAGPGIGTPPPGAIVVSANFSKFEQPSVQAPAGVAFVIWFENRENVPHNVHVVENSGANIALGEIFNGPAARPLDVPALAAGTYKLLCDVHPDMISELVAN
jgi:plastocyanin